MTKTQKVMILAVLASTVCTLPLEAGVISKPVQEVIELIAKKSGGKVLSQALKESAEQAFKKYGDDILKAIKTGGEDALKAGEKYGDDFWKLCKEVPDGAKVLAVNADEMIPLVKKHGIELLEIEAKAPGVGRELVKQFGDDTVKALAKAPVDDLGKLAGLAKRADSPATKKMLLETYQKSSNPSKFLDAITPKKILAAGVTAAIITAAYKVSDAAGDVIRDPETSVLGPLAEPVKYCGWIVGIIVCVLGGLWLYFKLKLNRNIFRELRFFKKLKSHRKSKQEKI